MRVEVTAEDIERGERWHGGRCPVALAMKRTWAHAMGKVQNDDVHCMADSFAITVDIGYRQVNTWRTPNAVREFMFEFDQGDHKRVSPFGFDLP